MNFPPGYSGSADRNNFSFTANQSGSGNVIVRVQNVCGFPTMPAAFNFFVNFCGGGYGFRASPNPTKDQLTVEAVDEAGNLLTPQGAVPSEAEFTFQLLNEKGKVLREGTSKNLRAETSVKGLARGIYFLSLSSGKKTEKRQIVLEN